MASDQPEDRTQPPKRSFSLTQIVVSAAVGFAISGLGGAALNEHLARAKPELLVQAIGYNTGNEDRMIQVPEALKVAMEASPWMRNLTDGQIELRKLRELLQSTTVTVDSLELVQGDVTSWLKGLESRGLEQKVSQLASYDIEASPFLSSNTLLSALLGELRRGSLPQPPVNFEELQRQNRLFELVDDRGSLWIDTPGRRINVGPSNRPRPAHFGESLARGNIRNLAFFGRYFVETAKKDIEHLAGVRRELAGVIASSSNFAVRLTAVNSGRTAVTLGPAFVIEVRSDANSTKLPLVVLSSDSASPSVGSFWELTLDRTSEQAPYGFVTLKPNDSQQITLTSPKALSLDDPIVESLLVCKGTCSARVAAFNSVGEVIVSRPVGVGAAFLHEVQSAVENALR